MKKVLVFLLLGLFVSVSNATVIDFEDAYADLGYQGQPTDYYAADGLTIGGYYFGLISGVSQGDTGNFNLEGTNSPASLAVNQIGQQIELNFGSAVNLSLDLGVSNGYESNIAVHTYLDNNFLNGSSSNYIDILNNGLGTWTTLSWSNIDRITLTATGGWRAWAIDNIQFDNVASVPEPTPLAMLALGLVGFGFFRNTKTV